VARAAAVGLVAVVARDVARAAGEKGNVAAEQDCAGEAAATATDGEATVTAVGVGCGSEG